MANLTKPLKYRNSKFCRLEAADDQFVSSLQEHLNYDVYSSLYVELHERLINQLYIQVGRQIRLECKYPTPSPV